MSKGSSNRSKAARSFQCASRLLKAPARAVRRLSLASAKGGSRSRKPTLRKPASSSARSMSAPQSRIDPHRVQVSVREIDATTRKVAATSHSRIAAASNALPFAPVSTTGGEPLSGGGVGPDPGSRCRPGVLPRFAAGALAGLPPPAWRFGVASQDRLTAALCSGDVPYRRWFLAALASPFSVCSHSRHRNRAWLLRFPGLSARTPDRTPTSSSRGFRRSRLLPCCGSPQPVRTPRCRSHGFLLGIISTSGEMAMRGIENWPNSPTMLACDTTSFDSVSRVNDSARHHTEHPEASPSPLSSPVRISCSRRRRRTVPASRRSLRSVHCSTQPQADGLFPRIHPPRGPPPWQTSTFPASTSTS